MHTLFPIRMQFMKILQKESLKFKNNLRIKQDSSFIMAFVYSTCSDVDRLTFPLSMHHLLFCSNLIFYEEVGHQRGIECISLIFRQSYTFGT